MTKIRQASTVEGALDRVVGILQREVAAKIIKKSETYLRTVGDPDKDRHLSLKDAMDLDKACLSESGETPFFAMQQLAIESTGFRGRSDVTAALLDMHAAAGRLTETIRAATLPQSPGGKSLTLAEKKRAHDLIDLVLGVVHGIRRNINDAPAGACAAKTSPQMPPFSARDPYDA